MPMNIINSPQIPLNSEMKELLRLMFRGRRRIVIRKAFTSGRTASRVLLIEPVPTEGGLLPVVVKIDHEATIKREWSAYQTCIKGRIPNVAKIDGEPTFLSESSLGGLIYPLAGDDAFAIMSLHQYIEQATPDAVQTLWQTQLQPTFNRLWRMFSVEPGFYFQTHYDASLPMNLTVVAQEMPSDASVASLNPHKEIPSVKTNDFVSLDAFYIDRIWYAENRLALNKPPKPEKGYRIHVKGIDNIIDYQEGESLKTPLTGKVVEVRAETLLAQAQTAVSYATDLSQLTLTLANGTQLPNPLHALPRLLSKSSTVRLSYIHGDLNMENVLVRADGGQIFLIDFALSRRDHVLRDLFHLESAILTKIVAPALARAELAATKVIPFYQQLHCALQQPNATVASPPHLETSFALLHAMRENGRRHLAEPDDWHEYYTGLAIYLLGSLRYPDLKTIPQAKATAFWGAATIIDLMHRPFPCEATASASPQRTSEETSVPKNQTNFYGSITGQIHTGDGDIHVTNTINPPIPQRPPGSSRGMFGQYEEGLQRLNTLISTSDIAQNSRQDVQLYTARLRENIRGAKRYGDTPTRRAERAEIIDILNELSTQIIGVSFNDLCR